MEKFWVKKMKIKQAHLHLMIAFTQAFFVRLIKTYWPYCFPILANPDIALWKNISKAKPDNAPFAT